MLAKPSIVFATGAGNTTLDQDEFGGNPFATALIELSGRDDLPIAKLLAALRTQTYRKSVGRQKPTWNELPNVRNWRIALPVGIRQERRAALVLIVADYPALAVPRLHGAANDERRIAAMLAGHGFSIRQGVASNRHSILDALSRFALESRQLDSAIIYSTGHGVQFGGDVYLLPGDYPFQSGYSARLLGTHAVSVERIAEAAKAASMNLTFFAGCRSNVSLE
jgi:hypothetical protein